MIEIKIIHVPSSIDQMQKRGPQIIQALIRRMNLLMLKLQAKAAGEKIPEMFPNGAPNIASEIRTIPARLEGTIIRGEVEGGGPRTTKRTLRSGATVDYAIVQHKGIDHSFTILPFNKKALAFMLDGKKIIRRSVTHPGLRPRPYLRASLEEMQEQIISELQQELIQALNA